MTPTQVLSSSAKRVDSPESEPKYDFSNVGVSSSFERTAGTTTTGSTTGITRKSFQGTNYIRVSANKIEGDTEGVKVLYRG